MKKRLLFLSLYGICIGLHGMDGSLDRSFGAGAGFVNSLAGVAFAIGIQIDGKIVAMGTNTAGYIITVRYNTNGTIDKTFGTDGIVTDATGIFASSLIIQPDGKIIIGGNDTAYQSFQLIRYNPNGTLDTTFGSGGVVIGPNGTGEVMALQTDSKIILAGSNNNTGLFEVVRYTPNGNIDVIFQSGPNEFSTGITIQSDGKIIVAGNSSVFDLRLVRYNTDGTLDSSFVAGVAPSGIWGPMVLQPDGKIIAVGNSFMQTLEAARFNTDGSVDATFGGGVISGPIGLANDIVLQADGKSVIVGGPTSDGPDFQLVRYTATGLLDATFGSGGIVQAPAGNVAFSSALQADGKIVAVGSDTATFMLFQVARYLNRPKITRTQICNISKKCSGVILCGTAQNPSQVYVFQNGILLGGTTTDPQGTNTWTFKVPRGCGAYSVAALYPDGHLTTVADRMWLK